MKIIIIGYYEFLKNLRDVKMFALLVIFPILITLILGNAIGGFFSNDIKNRLIVGYINQDTGDIGKALNNFLDNEEIKKKVEIINYGDEKQGQMALDSGKINAIIYLPSGLSQRVGTSEKQTIQVLGSKDVEYIQSMISSFITSYNGVKAVISVEGKSSDIGKVSNIKRIYYNKIEVKLSAMDYYAVLTLLQMLIVGAILGVFITTKNYGSDIHLRINSLPVSHLTLITGKIIGSTIYLFLAASINILFTKIVYGVNWNGNPLVITGTILAFCSIVIGIGVILGLFIGNFSTSLIVVMLMMIFFGTMSGAVSPAVVNDNISFLIPNYHAKILLFGTIYGYSQQVMIQSALWLLGIMVFVYVLIAVFIRRVSYDNI